VSHIAPVFPIENYSLLEEAAINISKEHCNAYFVIEKKTEYDNIRHMA
jgi:hypothetical protein